MDSDIEKEAEDLLLEPVSYTHLDVYKRQVYQRLLQRFKLRLCGRGHHRGRNLYRGDHASAGSDFKYWKEEPAVSYTHLNIKVWENPNTAECIRCGQCKSACPHGAIYDTCLLYTSRCV